MQLYLLKRMAALLYLFPVSPSLMGEGFYQLFIAKSNFLIMLNKNNLFFLTNNIEISSKILISMYFY